MNAAKSPALLVVALIGVLALGGSVQAQDGKESPGPYVVQMAAAAGGGYRLDGGGWQVRGAAAGPGYRLEAAGLPAGFGTPCCCVFLPCTLR